MLNRSSSESLVAELCAGDVDAVCQRVWEMRQRGMLRETEALGFLLWWMRSYLQASRFRPELSRRKLNVRNYLLKVVEGCIMEGLGDTLPAPGLRWTPEQREGQISRRAAAAAIHVSDSWWKQAGEELLFWPNLFPAVDLRELQAEILAGWAEEKYRYQGVPLTVGLLRTIQLNHILFLVWGIRR